ncbi:hypothetical protein IGI04_035553 [Brassica rapa subsp. trilocularis]|uniref:Uncharacterized protein n=1 Tax=Brassica rapa subsp. trilocularis TaxID=1813537 RepID=A0ABQ7LC21_BRACM|nr:hypothetical protein IGI04_035553 [Brassica rapa subsp. trilocularis]
MFVAECGREICMGLFWPFLLLIGTAISCLEMFETRALGLGQDLGLLSVKVCAVTSRLSFFLLRFLPDSYRFKVCDRFSTYMTCMIKRVIELRLVKTACVFVGANRRTGCKVFGGHVWTIYDNFTIFGPNEAAYKSLNVSRRVLTRGLRTRVEFRRPMRLRRQTILILAKIADIRCLVSRFPSLSAFTASELGLPFSQLLLFVPIGDFFFFFRHWFFEWGAFPSRSAPGPSWMSVDVLVGVVGDIARIQVNTFGFVILRVLCRGRKTFRVPLFDGRFLARWGSEVEPLPVDFGGSAGTDCLGPCRGEHLFKLLERRGVGLCVGRGYVRCWSVEIGAAASVKGSLHVIRIRQTVGTKIHTVDFRLNKETRKTLISQRTRISANYHTSSNQNTRITTIKYKKSKREQRRSYSEFAYERLQQGISLARELSARFLVLATLRRLNLIESQLEITKTENCLNCSKYSIFPDLHNYPQNFRIYPRKLDIYPSLWTKRKPCCGLRAFGPFGPSSDSTRLLRVLSIKNELSAVFNSQSLIDD